MRLAAFHVETASGEGAGPVIFSWEQHIGEVTK